MAAATEMSLGSGPCVAVDIGRYVVCVYVVILILIIFEVRSNVVVVDAHDVGNVLVDVGETLQN